MPFEFETATLHQNIPGYDLLFPVGRGSMGRVFVAKQRVLGRQVAIKFLSIDHDADPVERLARFQREAAIMAALSHQNVVPIFDFGETDDRPYLVMEYLEGGDLRRRMCQGKPMPVEQIRRVLIPIAEALQYLHSRGILHRDLKPENILMHTDGTPKVADFGIAVERSGSGELTQSGQGLGTLGYVAPEQQYRLPVDERADQYSLAAMTYEMFTGQRPLGIFKSPSHYNPEVRPATDVALMKGLQEDPGDRYPDVMSFCRAIELSLEGQATACTPRRRGGIAASVVGAAAVIGAVGWWALRDVASDTIKVHQPLPMTSQGDSAAFVAITRRCAVELWKEMGSPIGPGQGVDENNWFEAKAYAFALIEKLAYENYKRRGGLAQKHDPAKSQEDRDIAERTLVKEIGIIVESVPNYCHEIASSSAKRRSRDKTHGP